MTSLVTKPTLNIQHVFYSPFSCNFDCMHATYLNNAGSMLELTDHSLTMSEGAVVVKEWGVFRFLKASWVRLEENYKLKRGGGVI